MQLQSIEGGSLIVCKRKLNLGIELVSVVEAKEPPIKRVLNLVLCH